MFFYYIDKYYYSDIFLSRFLLGDKSRSKDEGGKFMDKMAEVLGRVGAWCGQNKYLSAIKNAFQNFMPLTIAGAVGVLWCNVLVNADTGLGMFLKPIMILDFLNPAFQAINFCTISCITVGIRVYSRACRTCSMVISDKYLSCS